MTASQRIKYTVTYGSECRACGRNKRLTNKGFKGKCAFCVFWDACIVVEAGGRSQAYTKRQKDVAWDIFLNMPREHRIRESSRRSGHKRRALLAESGGHFTSNQAAQILEMQGRQCAYCDARNNLVIDHVIPIAHGGSNWPWNLQWLCKSHNSMKGTKSDAEVREALGLNTVEPPSLIAWREFFRVSLYPVLG